MSEQAQDSRCRSRLGGGGGVGGVAGTQGRLTHSILRQVT